MNTRVFDILILRESTFKRSKGKKLIFLNFTEFRGNISGENISQSFTHSSTFHLCFSPNYAFKSFFWYTSSTPFNEMRGLFWELFINEYLNKISWYFLTTIPELVKYARDISPTFLFHIFELLKKLNILITKSTDQCQML
ncbi:hypothetical protein EGR_02675 [Echinococcus granulosus]|uniref:Uncharacterized protein n=1 Tax=Echinococcus granulosus TaxID=6210 RepID=W6UN60_ECHGR|nr:hypothetical protein EGR_02675 [Echinococcus granulosus]EUB62543.1 hypothetical protein EGR_02675 [Echinococcus granulosus]